MIGRQAMGAGVIMMMGQFYQADMLHGNGPLDRARRQTWRDNGIRPKEIKIGNVWVSTAFFEPYGTIMDAVADVYDNMNVLGEKETTNQLIKLSNIVGQALFDKSYLQGISQVIDVMNQEGTGQQLAARYLNNLIPLSSLRNDIGKLITPYMLEHNRQFNEVLAERNRFIDGSLPIKYDILSPNPINDWSFATRVFNMISPVKLNLDYSPGRQLILDSQYDLKQSVNVSPEFMGLEGIKLYDYPIVRSMFQKPWENKCY